MIARKIAILLVTIGAIALADVRLSTGTHPLQVLHVVFRGLYLLPVVAGAVWFRVPGGLVCAAAVSVAYARHLALAWPDQASEDANQLAMIGVFLLVGLVSGLLVERQERERAQYLDAERRSQRAAVVQAIAGLSTALGVRDKYTRAHSEAVARLAVEIGRARGLSDERLDMLRLAALMHDVGKIGVPDDILLKAAELTPAERERIQRHPSLAADILRPIRGTEEIANIILSHHECPDGSGYPRGLVGEQIPVEAAILRVADVFTALTDQRSYKPALDRDRALASVHQMSGTKLDAPSVRLLDDVLQHREQVSAPRMA